MTQNKPKTQKHAKEDCPQNNQPSYEIKVLKRARYSAKADRPDNSRGGLQLLKCRVCGKRWYA